MQKAEGQTQDEVECSARGGTFNGAAPGLASLFWPLVWSSLLISSTLFFGYCTPSMADPDAASDKRKALTIQCIRPATCTYLMEEYKYSLQSLPDLNYF